MHGSCTRHALKFRESERESHLKSAQSAAFSQQARRQQRRWAPGKTENCNCNCNCNLYVPLIQIVKMRTHSPVWRHEVIYQFATDNNAAFGP